MIHPAAPSGGDPSENGRAARLYGAPAPAEPEVAGFREYWTALRRHKALILVGALLGGGLAAWRVNATEPTLASVAVLQISQPAGSGGGGGLAGLAASLSGGSNLDSQVQVLRSRLILGQVVDSLGLRLQRQVSDPWRTRFFPTSVVSDVRVPDDLPQDTLELEFAAASVRVRTSRGAQAEAPYGAPVEVDGVRFRVPAHPGRDELTLFVLPRRSAIDVISESVRPNVRSGTDVVDVTVVGYDPAFTERIANAVADRYRAYVGAEARGAALRQREWVVQQMRATEAELRQAQDELTAFRQREQLYSSRAKLVAGQASGGEVELERASLSAERGMYRELLARLERTDRPEDALRTLVSSPTMAENPVVVDLYGRLSAYQSTRDSLTVGPGSRSADNPDIQRLDSLIRTVQQRMVVATRSHIEAIDARMAALDELLGRSEAEIQALARSEPEELRLLMQVEGLGEALMQLRERFYTVSVAEVVGDERVEVLDAALPGSLAGVGPGRTILLGLIFGLMVGGGGAIALDAVNRSIRRRDDLERHLRVPGLAVIPQIGAVSAPRAVLRLAQRARGAGNGSGVPAARELVTATDVHSIGAEAYRSLWAKLAFSQAFQGLKTVVVTSAFGGEGKTTTASNLAVTFAQQGLRVLLVDGDVRRARLHDLFQAPRSPGLAEVVQGQADAREAVRRTAVDGLAVLTAGTPAPGRAADLLSGGGVHAVVESLAADFDLVVVDAPPVLVTAEAAVFGATMDGVILVVRAGQTDRDTAREALDHLSAVGARVVGAVLNDPDAAVTRAAGSYYEATLAAN